DRLGDVQGGPAPRALEQDVLQVVARSGVGGRLVAGADRRPDAEGGGPHRRHRLGDDPQSAGEDGAAHRAAAVGVDRGGGAGLLRPRRQGHASLAFGRWRTVRPGTPRGARPVTGTGQEVRCPASSPPRRVRRRRGRRSPSSRRSRDSPVSPPEDSEAPSPESPPPFWASFSMTSTGTSDSLPRWSISVTSTWILSPTFRTSSTFSIRAPPCSLRICET